MGIHTAQIPCDQQASGSQLDPNTCYRQSGNKTPSGYFGSFGYWLTYWHFPFLSYLNPYIVYIFSAVLNAYPVTVSDPGSTHQDLYSIRADLDENSVSWNNSSNNVITSYPDQFVPSADFTGWDRTADVQDRIDNNYNGGFAAYPASSFANNVYWFYRGDPYLFPRFDVRYGYKVTTVVVNPGVRQVSVNWSGVPGGAGAQYRVRLLIGASVIQSVTLPEGTYSHVFTGVHSGTYRVDVCSVYDDGPTPAITTGSITVTPGTTPSFTASGDTPVRKEVSISPVSTPSGAVWNYNIRDSANNIVALSGGNSGATKVFDLSARPDGTYTVFANISYSDGDATAFVTFSVTISTPTITGLSCSQNGFRQITATWNRLTDAASYNVKLDGGTPISVTNPGSGSTVNHTFTSVTSGSHTILVTPVYTNGYQLLTTPTVQAQSALGVSQKPTPAAATSITGDSPNKRELTVGIVSGPSSFFSADYWELRYDNKDVTIITSTTSSAMFSQVPAGTHTVQIRGRWTADSDSSNWSTSSSVGTVTSPTVINVAARQRSADYNVPGVSTLSTGGTIPAGSYYVAYSVNKGGNATTEAGAPSGRLINESSPSTFATITVAGSTSTITITPGSITTGDTWNVYIGTDRNKLKRVIQNLTAATTTYTITSYTAPSINESKLGKIDLAWSNPTGVGDAPTSYRVERVPNIPENDPNGVIGSAWVDVTTRSFAGFYNTTKFYEDSLDTKFYHYRIYARYTNADSTIDTSSSVDVVI